MSNNLTRKEEYIGHRERKIKTISSKYILEEYTVHTYTNTNYDFKTQNLKHIKNSQRTAIQRSSIKSICTYNRNVCRL